MFSMLLAKEKCLSYVWNHRYQSIQIWPLISRAIFLSPLRKSIKRNPHTRPLRRIWIHPPHKPLHASSVSDPAFQINPDLAFNLVRIQIRLSKYADLGRNNTACRICCKWWPIHCKWRAVRIQYKCLVQYSQKWNSAALLFPKQNYNVLSLNFHIHVSLSDLCILTIRLLKARRGIYKSLTDTWM
jgi:hypothetical protein